MPIQGSRGGVKRPISDPLFCYSERSYRGNMPASYQMLEGLTTPASSLAQDSTLGPIQSLKLPVTQPMRQTPMAKTPKSRKSGRAIKLWGLRLPHFPPWFQYAEREDGQMFFRYLETRRGMKWGKWTQCEQDPRRADGTIPSNMRFGNLYSRTGDLGRIRLPRTDLERGQ